MATASKIIRLGSQSLENEPNVLISGTKSCGKVRADRIDNLDMRYSL